MVYLYFESNVLLKSVIRIITIYKYKFCSHCGLQTVQGFEKMCTTENLVPPWFTICTINIPHNGAHVLVYLVVQACSYLFIFIFLVALWFTNCNATIRGRLIICSNPAVECKNDAFLSVVALSEVYARV